MNLPKKDNRCHKCGKHQDVLSSYVLPGEKMGFAMCDDCLKAAKKEAGDAA